MLDAKQYVELLEMEGSLVRSAEFKTNAFGDYRPTSADVIVSTYPKRGTNWVMQMAQEIAWRGDAQFEHVDSAIPWPDATVKTPIVPLSDTTMASNAPTGLRIIKSHMEAPFVPFNSAAKYISVVRDPKDVIVSAFHFENGFMQKMVGAGVPLHGYVEAFLGRRFIYNEWADHVAGWWALREEPNVLLLLYEEMKRAPEQAIGQITELMGVELSAEQFAAVVHKSSYAYMKANNHKFSPPTPPDYPEQGQIVMVREGKSGGAAKTLSAEQRHAIDQFCLGQLAELDSTFPYHECYIARH